MRRKETQKISEILNEFRQNSPLNQKLLETQVVANWNTLLGPVIASSTRNIYFSNRVLYVFIDSSVMRHELFMMRSQIQDALNKSVGSKVVDNIVFR
jgi:predicted nucleic acid-binding Zn ribbon protein